MISLFLWIPFKTFLMFLPVFLPILLSPLLLGQGLVIGFGHKLVLWTGIAQATCPAIFNGGGWTGTNHVTVLSPGHKSTMGECILEDKKFALSFTTN
jgi:hypothetical protein